MQGKDHVQHAIRAGQVPAIGVNLGGWLVVEHWINDQDTMWTNVPNDVMNFTICTLIILFEKNVIVENFKATTTNQLLYSFFTKLHKKNLSLFNVNVSRSDCERR